MNGESLPEAFERKVDVFVSEALRRYFPPRPSCMLMRAESQ